MKSDFLAKFILFIFSDANWLFDKKIYIFCLF